MFSPLFDDRLHETRIMQNGVGLFMQTLIWQRKTDAWKITLEPLCIHSKVEWWRAGIFFSLSFCLSRVFHVQSSHHYLNYFELMLPECFVCRLCTISPISVKKTVAAHQYDNYKRLQKHRGENWICYIVSGEVQDDSLFFYSVVIQIDTVFPFHLANGTIE